MWRARRPSPMQTSAIRQPGALRPAQWRSCRFQFRNQLVRGGCFWQQRRCLFAGGVHRDDQCRLVFHHDNVGINHVGRSAASTSMMALTSVYVRRFFASSSSLNDLPVLNPCLSFQPPISPRRFARPGPDTSDATGDVIMLTTSPPSPAQVRPGQDSPMPAPPVLDRGSSRSPTCYRRLQREARRAVRPCGCAATFPELARSLRRRLACRARISLNCRDTTRFACKAHLLR